MERNLKALMTALSEAIDAYDVGATIADDDVEKWNEVMRTRDALRAAIEENA